LNKIVDLGQRILSKLRKVNIIRVLFIFIGICLILDSTAVIAKAGIMEAIGSPDIFQNLGGDAKYISATYRGNYYLDTVTLGFTDVYSKAVKFIANFVWSGVVILTYLCILAFHFAFSMDLANMFSGMMESTLAALKAGIFDRYWLLIFAIAFIFIVIAFARNNISLMVSRITYTVIALVLATAIVKYATPIVSLMTNVSKSMGASSVVAIATSGQAGGDPTEEANKEIARISAQLWINLVHKPYLDLEGDNKLSGQEIDRILSLNPKSEERQKYIDEINKKDKTLFEETAGEDRIFPAIIILAVNLIKMVILFLISLIQIVFQTFTIVLVFAFPLVILLSIIPALGGAGVVGEILKQIISTQIGIVLTSLLLGVIIQVDNLIGNIFKGSTQYGWFFASFIQAMIFLGIIWQRKQIFNLFASVQRKFNASSTNVWDKATRAGDKLAASGHGMKEGISDKASNLRNWTGDKVARGATFAADGIRAADAAIGNYFKNKASDDGSKSTGENTTKKSSGRKSTGGQSTSKSKRRVVVPEQQKTPDNAGGLGTAVRGESMDSNRRSVVILGEDQVDEVNKNTGRKINLNDRIQSSEKESQEAEEIKKKRASMTELELARERMKKGNKDHNIEMKQGKELGQNKISSGSEMFNKPSENKNMGNLTEKNIVDGDTEDVSGKTLILDGSEKNTKQIKETGKGNVKDNVNQASKQDEKYQEDKVLDRDGMIEKTNRVNDNSTLVEKLKDDEKASSSEGKPVVLEEPKTNTEREKDSKKNIKNNLSQTVKRDEKFQDNKVLDRETIAEKANNKDSSNILIEKKIQDDNVVETKEKTVVLEDPSVDTNKRLDNSSRQEGRDSDKAVRNKSLDQRIKEKKENDISQHDRATMFSKKYKK